MLSNSDTEDYMLINKLPERLNNKDEKIILDEFIKGDQNARATLIERNLRLVAYIANKFKNPNIEREDLISIGTIGLIKAVSTFNANKGIKLATYASRCIENEILIYMRKNNRIKTKCEMSIDEPISTDSNGNELYISDIIGTSNDIIFETIEEKINKKILIDALAKLNDRDKKIIELRFIKNGGMTQRELSSIMGITQSYISRLEHSIIDELKYYIKCNI